MWVSSYRSTSTSDDYDLLKKAIAFDEINKFAEKCNWLSPVIQDLFAISDFRKYHFLSDSSGTGSDRPMQLWVLKCLYGSYAFAHMYLFHSKSLKYKLERNEKIDYVGRRTYVASIKYIQWNHLWQYQISCELNTSLYKKHARLYTHTLRTNYILYFNMTEKRAIRRCCENIKKVTLNELHQLANV